MEPMDLLVYFLKDNKLEDYLLELAHACSISNNADRYDCPTAEALVMIERLADRVANDFIEIAKAENAEITEEAIKQIPAVTNLMLKFLALPCITSVRLAAKHSCVDDPEGELRNTFKIYVTDAVMLAASINGKESTEDERNKTKEMLFGSSKEEKSEEESNKGLSYDDLDEETKRIVDEYRKPKFTGGDPNNGLFFA